MRNLSIDYLKVALAVAVVLLHSLFLMKEFPEIGYTLVNGLFRLAVPLFLIITGYYFTQITTHEKFKTWFIRLFILYAVWMIFYTPFWFHIENIKGTLITAITGYFVLWYLSGVLFGGTLLFFLRKLDTKYLFLISIVLYLIGYFIQQIGNLHFLMPKLDGILNWFPISRNFLFLCFPLLTLGFLIKRLNLDEKLKPSLALIIFLIALVLVESYLNYKFISKTEPLDHLLTILIASPLIFTFVKNKKILGDNKNLASFSTAIFLIHPFFISIYNYFIIDLYKVIFVLIATIVTSLVLVLINKKVKYLL